MHQHSTSGLVLLAALSLSSFSPLLAQVLDPGFQPTILKNNTTTTPLNVQSAPQLVAVQPDGKVLAGGGFDFMNGAVAGKIQRLNPDGTNDASFNPGGIGANGFLAAMLLQPDGKILIGGGFTAYNATPILSVARLNTNGTLDAGFSSTGLPFASQVGAMALQPDGKILVGGTMSIQNTTPNPGIIRLNADGTPDATFNVGAGATSANSIVRSILVQADGKILVGGSFTTFSGQTVGNLVRLNPNGSLDTSFAIGTGTDASVRAMVQQPDGKLVLGGLFTTFNGQPASRLIRLNVNGSVDASFAVGSGPNNSVFTLLLQPSSSPLLNDNLVVGGSFTQFNGQTRNRLARVAANGTLDASFGTGTGVGTGSIASVAPIGNGQLVAAGAFNSYDGVAKTGLTRLTATGGNDPSFAARMEARGSLSAFPLANGKILVTGSYTEINGITPTGSSLRRLNSDGTVDQSYSGTGSFLGVQPDGSFFNLTGSLPPNTHALQRVLPSGALDNAFTSLPLRQLAGLPFRLAVTVQPDGKILVGGSFDSFGGVPYNGLVRLLPNGNLDNTFTPPSSAPPRIILSSTVQANGKIVIKYQEGITSPFPGMQLARLNADGSPDNTFPIGTGTGPNANFNVIQQPDGKLLLPGLSEFNGQMFPFNALRLNADGTVDNTFSLAAPYALLAVQPDGRILASNTLRGAHAVLRLNANGSPDNTFTPVSVPLSYFVGEDQLTGLAIQPADNKILLFGSFRSVAGQLRIGLARLTNPNATATRAASATLPLEVHPNPVREHLTVALPALAAPVQATLLDLTGRTIRTWTLPAQRTEARLDLSTVAAGVYVLRIPAPGGAYQQKVAVTH